jgi:hypothetical protein
MQAGSLRGMEPWNPTFRKERHMGNLLFLEQGRVKAGHPAIRYQTIL